MTTDSSLGSPMEPNLSSVLDFDAVGLLPETGPPLLGSYEADDFCTIDDPESPLHLIGHDLDEFLGSPVLPENLTDADVPNLQAPLGPGSVCVQDPVLASSELEPQSCSRKTASTPEIVTQWSIPTTDLENPKESEIEPKNELENPIDGFSDTAIVQWETETDTVKTGEQNSLN